MTPPPLQSAKRVTINSPEHPEQLFGVEINDFLEDEAEVSGSEDSGSNEREDYQCDDGYEDSFINDNTLLTQYPSTGSCVNKDTPPMGSRKRSSPIGPCRNRYRMVLSQRHTILNRLMKNDSNCEAVAKKKKSDIHAGDDHQVMYGDQENMGTGHGSDAEMEAEEIFIEYGEEDREELTYTQPLPEDSTMGEEQVPTVEEQVPTVEEQVSGGFTPGGVDSTVIGEQCADKDISDSCVVDSSLMVSY